MVHYPKAAHRAGKLSDVVNSTKWTCPQNGRFSSKAPEPELCRAFVKPKGKGPAL
jgi:hypothetical protein